MSFREGLQNAAWIVGIFAGMVAFINGIDVWLKNHDIKKMYASFTRIFRKGKNDKCDSPTE